MMAAISLKMWKQLLARLVFLFSLALGTCVLAQKVEEKAPIARLDQEIADDLRRLGLRGIERVDVQIEGLTHDTQQQGFTYEAVRTDVELRLRSAGIKLVTREEIAARKPFAILTVRFNFTTEGDAAKGLYIFIVTVELSQGVTLVRDPSVFLLAATWRKEMFGTVGAKNLKDLRGIVTDLVGSFANDMLAVNPPSKPTTGSTK